MTTTDTTRNRTSRRLMKMAGGAVVLGILATTGCAPSERTAASPTPAQPTVSLAPGDTSRGADNYYSSDRVTAQKVTFTNQYQTRSRCVPRPSRSLNAVSCANCARSPPTRTWCGSR
jgi:hypothetical protein